VPIFGHAVSVSIFGKADKGAAMTSTAIEPAADVVATDEDVLAEVLVEEISIDGMCGVY
jgi:mycofactocin precursor